MHYKDLFLRRNLNLNNILGILLIVFVEQLSKDLKRTIILIVEQSLGQPKAPLNLFVLYEIK